jgi:hypothetical protein
MAGTIVTDRIESDATYNSKIELVSPVLVSNTFSVKSTGGTGNFNIVGANTNTDRTVTLLDTSGVLGYAGTPRSGAAKTGSYTLVATDIGQMIEVGSGGSVTIPNSVFQTGDMVSIFNNTSGSITITCSITTAYISGVNTDKDTVSLLTRGVCTVLFVDATTCVLAGSVT